MVVRALALALIVWCLSSSVSTAFERLPVPGGTNRLRQVTGMPASVTDALLLAEAVRAWYGSKDPIAAPPPPLRRLLEYIKSPDGPLAPGPVLPLTTATWNELLSLKRSDNLAASLIVNRNAMLLYRGLVGMDDESLAWLQRNPAVLKALLRKGAPTFAFAAPAVRVRDGAVAVPGGASARAAWEAVVGESVSQPEPFITRLMQRSGGRIAWLFSALAELDPGRVRFALAGGEPALRALVRHAAAASPEWVIDDRPFWRPAFDMTLVLSLVDLGADGTPRGSEAFWREVFRSDDLQNWRGTAQGPLSAVALIEILFERSYTARDRWEVLCLGQRTPGTDRDLETVGLMLRGASRHPALAQMLDRIRMTEPGLVLRVHRAAARVADKDPVNADGVLGAWQGALAIVERSTLTGGLDRAAASETIAELAALPLDSPRAELTAWLMGTFLPRLQRRPSAPADVDSVVLQTISGRLTPSGARQETVFTWEDLRYSVGTPRSLVSRMQEAAAAQGSATLEDARMAWHLAEGRAINLDDLIHRLYLPRRPHGLEEFAKRIESAHKERDAGALGREARRAAERISLALLAALPYAPHLAVTETPSLGAEIAYRHEFVAPDDGSESRRARPWQVARGEARSGSEWHLQGSLLMLDIALADWYLRRNGDPPAAAPVLDERDVTTLAHVAAIARSSPAEPSGLEDASIAVTAGRRAAASTGTGELDRKLADAGIDPWRRRGLRLDSEAPAEIAARLTLVEAWRLGGAPGRLAPRTPLDGGARLGAVPHSTALVEGRRSAGVVGATAIDTQLRVAMFLHARQLPTELFGEIAAGALNDVIESANATRPDDFAAIAAAVALLDDTRMEEHLLALVRDGTLMRPSQELE